ncbi:hypothetical protein GQ55_5G042200 [Panicum hallii var. hallii]|uniref:Uncharacterized protein n=1 Tax=Panicum hallii var. hallii TaxID=1504633 RepID=A0A2T7DCH5_9POAL|nr:hypothetical protein GQ55_5G042200 [Panicum hallii var. hallii]
MRPERVSPARAQTGESERGAAFAGRVGKRCAEAGGAGHARVGGAERHRGGWRRAERVAEAGGSDAHASGVGGRRAAGGAELRPAGPAARGGQEWAERGRWSRDGRREAGDQGSGRKRAVGGRRKSRGRR